VSDYEGLKSFAILANVRDANGTERPDHVKSLQKIANSADLVFLVGKVAQRTIQRGIEHFVSCWVDGKYVGVPHPSGLNRQLNDGGDAATGAFVHAVLKSYRPPDRPLDVPHRGWGPFWEHHDGLD
jgi:hypothetical protein